MLSLIDLVIVTFFLKIEFQTGIRVHICIGMNVH